MEQKKKSIEQILDPNKCEKWLERRDSSKQCGNPKQKGKKYCHIHKKETKTNRK